mmetsp:Transcript_8014/g.23718  ORF Transcript_8014/g.23718 Transcript_8014/m.23718 type:complete len:330 (+) Transcript_8014:1515-2504(+)
MHSVSNDSYTPSRNSHGPAAKYLLKILRVSMISLKATKFSMRHVNMILRPCAAGPAERSAGGTAGGGHVDSDVPIGGCAASGGGKARASAFSSARVRGATATSCTSVDSFNTSTSAEKMTVSLTRKPASWSKRLVSVTNSRQPQSFAALEYLFWLSFATARSSVFWFTTVRRWLTKQDHSVPPMRGSVTSRNIDRWFGGCDWPRGYTIRRQSRLPIWKWRLLMQSAVILRFFSRSFSRVKFSMRHTKRPLYPSPLLPLFDLLRFRAELLRSRFRTKLVDSLMMWKDAENTAVSSTVYPNSGSRNSDTGMKSFHPRLVLSPLLLSAANRP